MPWLYERTDATADLSRHPNVPALLADASRASDRYEFTAPASRRHNAGETVACVGAAFAPSGLRKARSQVGIDR
jgi:hypothetical protein